MSGFHTIIKVLYLIFRSRRQKILFFLVLSTISLTAVGAAVFPIFFSMGIDALSDIKKDNNEAIFYIICFGSGFIFVGLLEEIQWIIFGPMNLSLQRHLTVHVIEHAISLPYSRLKTYTTYEIGRIVEKGLDSVRDITSNMTFLLIPTVMELAISVSVIAFMIDVWISFFLFIALLIYGCVANISAGRIRTTTEDAMQGSVEAWKFGLDGVANAELIQQSAMGLAFSGKFNEKLNVNDRVWGITFGQRSGYGSLQALIFGAVVLGVLWRGALDVGAGALSIGDLVLLNTYIIRLLRPLETFARVYRDVHASLGEARLLAQMLAIEIPRPTQYPSISTEGPWGLEARDVTITVEGRPLIEKTSFVVGKGQYLFILGSSGVGKSSLLKVLSCIITADNGEYLIDGQNVTDDTAAVFRKDIAVVQQECLIFDWTIWDNIAFGVEGPDARIETVIEQLGLGEVMNRHRELGEPTVGERGARLSGGEKKRLSLARALLRQPRLLLLDEPTAALDKGNRKRVLSSINSLQGKSSMVFVTHDLSLVENESQILFLVGDTTTRFGRHQDLLSRSPQYKRFVEGVETLESR